MGRSSNLIKRESRTCMWNNLPGLYFLLSLFPSAICLNFYIFFRLFIKAAILGQYQFGSFWPFPVSWPVLDTFPFYVPSGNFSFLWWLFLSSVSGFVLIFLYGAWLWFTNNFFFFFQVSWNFVVVLLRGILGKSWNPMDESKWGSDWSGKKIQWMASVCEKFSWRRSGRRLTDFRNSSMTYMEASTRRRHLFTECLIGWRVADALGQLVKFCDFKSLKISPRRLDVGPMLAQRRSDVRTCIRQI